LSELTHLTADCAIEDIQTTMERDGACIIDDLISPASVDVVLDELSDFMDLSALGRDDFTGRRTERVGALIARSESVRPVVTNPVVTAGARRFLGEYCDRIQLHLTQTIRILPGQGYQALHRDREAWGRYLPRSVEPQFNTIWAMTDFTRENGATRVVPGSNHWPYEQKAEADEFAFAEMNKGSVLLYNGSVLHSGGNNESNVERIGLNITYCLGWLRQEENQYLSCPPDIARDLDPGLQELLGYTMGNYALGYYSRPDLEGEGPRDVIPPEFVLGRKPRPESKFMAFEEQA
jgi:ectoine hydroxylase-related dioxygenase (phytanoyl-CoA dioxygenase family)